jgi:hypothetical protein
MVVNYNNAHNGLRYNCSHSLACYGEPECQSLSGKRLDALVAEQVLAALQPAALELHLAAAADLEQQRQQLHQHWQQRLERATYEAERAARQYHAVEPENRLVARELERRWNEALGEQQRLQREYEQFCAARPARLSAAEREQVRQLAEDIPALWSSPTTTAADRQRLVRLLIEQVEVTVEGQSERVRVSIRWSGGDVSHHELVRSVRSYAQLSDYGRLWERIDALRGEGKSMAAVAAALNAEGFRPPKGAERFSGGMVGGLLTRQCAGPGGSRGESVSGALRAGEWLLGELARYLGMPAATLHHWVRAGWVRARKLSVPGGFWAVWATGAERRRLGRLRRYQQAHPNQAIPAGLKRPGSVKRRK